jgi:hypothetical protein
MKIKSSAIAYSLVFVMLTTLICSGLLFISSVNKRIETNYLIEDNLLVNNLFSIQYASHFNLKGDYSLFHPTGDTSTIHQQQWGAFDIMYVETKHGLRKVEKSVLLGVQAEQELPAIYIPDFGVSLKVGGDVMLEGELFIPKGKLEKTYFGGIQKNVSYTVDSRIRSSEKLLPPVNKVFEKFDFQNVLLNGIKIDSPIRDTIHSFQKKTLIYSLNSPILIQCSLAGNIIVHSFDSIVVSKTAQLKDVILYSPKVRFEEGFVGSVQVIAHDQITLEKNVQLNYPSTLSLYPVKDNIQSSIFIDEDCKVIGGILLYDASKMLRTLPMLTSKKGSILGGIVYNIGETEIEGKIIGSLFTSIIKHQKSGGVYKNQLVDIYVSSEKLPDSFLYPRWILQKEQAKNKVLKWF